MKKTITKIGMAMLIGITAIVFNGCKGKDGAPGAQGPAGIANISTTTATTTNASWTFLSAYNEWDATLNYSAITSDIVATGTVQVYLGDGSSTVWAALPNSYHNFEWGYQYSLGQVTIFVTKGDGTDPGNPGGMQFKFVAIPSRSMMLHPNVNMKNYNEVKQTFNLHD